MGGGTKLDDPSLDLCNGVYPSEKERIERRQVAATKVGSTFAFLSSEVVRYSSAAAAIAAEENRVRIEDSIAAASSYQMNGEPYAVNSEKCYFYTEPNINTKRSAYLVYGETVYPMERRNGFFYVEFTNPSGQTTKGWVQDSDLNSL
jgi:hypothetical protein